MTAQSGLLDIKELCDYLKISKNTAYILIHSEGFPKIKIGRIYRFKEESLKKWLEEHTV